MPNPFAAFLGQSLRRVLYYQATECRETYWAGMHDVGQGVELAFDTGHVFVTWATQFSASGLYIQTGRMIDWLRGGVFDDASENADWNPLIGQPLAEAYLGAHDLMLSFGTAKVFVVTGEVDRETLTVDGMADNLAVLFGEERRRAFWAQYPNVRVYTGANETS